MKNISVVILIIILIIFILITCDNTKNDEIYDSGASTTNITEDGIIYIDNIINDKSFKAIMSSLERDNTPDIDDNEFRSQTELNNIFALELYDRFKNEFQNIIFSPYSISEAMAMVYGGALNNTKNQIKEVLNFDASNDNKIYRYFNKMNMNLEKSIITGNLYDPFLINLNNSFWGEKNLVFKKDFLDILSKNFDAGINLMDFILNTEQSRLIINSWIEEKTNGIFKDVLQPGSIDPTTRVVLVNSIYFNAHWDIYFDKLGNKQFFYDLSGDPHEVDMMYKHETRYYYKEGIGYKTVKCDYVNNDYSMYLIVPDSGDFTNFENGFDYIKLNDAINGLSLQNLNLYIPKWTFDTNIDLKKYLIGMGMTDAFNAATADFSNITQFENLFISGIIHKGFIKVTEYATEAAAVTVITMAGCTTTIIQEEIIEFKIDRPYIYLIRNNATGTILFLGRVMTPQ